MGYPPVSSDNPRALVSGLSYVHWWTNMVKLFYTTYMYISVDLAHHKIFCAKVGKGGKISYPLV